MQKKLKFISQAEELAGIQKLIYEYKRKHQNFANERTLVYRSRIFYPRQSSLRAAFSYMGTEMLHFYDRKLQ